MTTAFRVPIDSLSDTEVLARGFARSVLSHPPKKLLVALQGTLGSGKTQWVRYFCGELGIAAEEVTSPTYVLLQQYKGLRTVQHLDLYRLSSAAEVWDLGLDEMLELPHIVVVEWADRFPECLPESRLTIELMHREEGRLAQVTAAGAHPTAILEAAVAGTATQLTWSYFDADAG